MSIEYWVSCAREPWAALRTELEELRVSLVEQGDGFLQGVSLTIGSAPAFVPPGVAVINASGSAGAGWDDVLDVLGALAEAGNGVVIGEDERPVFDYREIQPGLPSPLDTSWVSTIDTQNLTVMVFASRRPRPPREVLRDAGLDEIANRIRAPGVWNESAFGTVRINSCPCSGSVRLIASKAGFDPDRNALAIRFTGPPEADWTDALIAAQALARDVNGAAYAFYRGTGDARYDDYHRAVKVPS